jgi:hypothetical protein
MHIRFWRRRRQFFYVFVFSLHVTPARQIVQYDIRRLAG